MIPNVSNHLLIETWADRTRDSSLHAAEARIRSRVEALYLASENMTRASARALARRCLSEAEGLLGLVEKAMDVPEDPTPWQAPRRKCKAKAT